MHQLKALVLNVSQLDPQVPPLPWKQHICSSVPSAATAAGHCSGQLPAPISVPLSSNPQARLFSERQGTAAITTAPFQPMAQQHRQCVKMSALLLLLCPNSPPCPPSQVYCPHSTFGLEKPYQQNSVVQQSSQHRV